jgi:ABC-type antimicrobial peptide transport system permease subunit
MRLCVAVAFVVPGFLIGALFRGDLVYGLAGAGLTVLLLAAVGKVPLAYNYRNLVVRWRITFLTALAFTLVVALLTVMLAFVQGMYRLTEGSSQPGNVLVLSDGATDEAFSNLGYSDIGDVEREPGVLRDEDGRALCSKEVYIIVNQPIPNAKPGERQRRFTQIRGVEDSALSGRVHSLDLFAGGAWLSPAGAEVVPVEKGGGIEPCIQAVLGAGMAREMGRDRGREALDVGDVFDLGPRKWIVTGVMKSAGTTFDSEIWAKKQVVGPMFGKDNFSTLVLRTADAASARALAYHLANNFKKASLQAQVESEYYEKLNATNQQFLYSIGFVAVIMSVGGIFGVMNTMFAAISQRIKDIGVLRILGFSREQILVSFLLESLAIALVGGLLGCALGSLADGWSATSIISGGPGSGKSVVLKMVVDWNILALGMLVAVLMGWLGGLFPAVSAMRLRPLESLR